MKIFEAEQIRRADEATVKSQGITSLELMERASLACTMEIKKLVQPDDCLFVFCGNGNNGGDGLAIARMLHSEGYSVKVFILEFLLQATPDFSQNLGRLYSMDQIEINLLKEPKDFPDIHHCLVIDALMGTGASRPAEGLLHQLINHLNHTQCRIVSIDLPSGMPADGIRDFDRWKNAVMIKAAITLTFEMPKLCFFYPETGPYAGTWRILNIGLSEDFIASTNSPYQYTVTDDLMGCIMPRAKFAHKGNYGHLLLIAGSAGKSGAALLASRAAMRTGCGKLTLCADQKTLDALNVYLPEAMTWNAGIASVEDLPNLKDFNAIAIGPGLGTGEGAQRVLKRLLQDWKGPLLVDADGLNILSENPTWLNWLPQGAVLTPHPLELRRLTRNYSGTFFDLMNSAVELAQKHSIFINLKSTYSCLITPSGRFFFNSSGIPALSKAGTGDVLSGVIGALLCTGLSSTESVCVGNYLQGRAAQLAVEQESQHSLLAGEIEGFIGLAIKEIEN